MPTKKRSEATSRAMRPDEEVIPSAELQFEPRKNEFRRKKSAADTSGADAGTLDIIAIQLKASREARGVSISQLHASTGIARTALHDYEAGRYKPGANEIRKLCDALGITPNKLLTGRENPITQQTPLEAVFGSGSEELQIMKAGRLLSMLPLDEREAFYKLLLGIVSSRYAQDKLQAAMEQIEVMAGIMNMAAAHVANPDEEISEEAVKRRMAEINPELVSDERAERVKREREAKRSKPPAEGGETEA